VAVVFFASLVIIGLMGWALTQTVIEHRRLQRELRDCRKQCEALSQNLLHQGTLAKEVAHELKNPISAVVCAAETLELLMDDRLDETNRSTLHYIKEYGEHVLTVMHDFIDISRGLCGQVVCSKESVRIAEAVTSVVGLLAPSAGRKSISFNTSRIDFDAWGHVDPKHLKQILFNLAHNSVKFTPPGGEISIFVEDVEAADFVLMRVSDTGEGISEEQLQHLFSGVGSPHRRELSSDTGCGIGLALTKMLIELEGGHLTIRSAVGVGTTVTVTLPRSVPEVAASEADLAVSLDVRPFAGQAVLLVDGNRGVRDVLSRLIETLGGAVDAVGEAAHAIEALHRKSYSVVMIDESIDAGDSGDLVRQLRRDPNSKNTRFVVATNHPVDTQSLLESGADRAVEKPLNSKALIESLLATH
jgi:signal transduction histidine kinase